MQIKNVAESDVPLCTEDNAIRYKFQHLLSKKLDFSHRLAAEYGAVMCNFLAGLRKQVRQNNTAHETLFEEATSRTAASFDYIKTLSQPLRFPPRRKRRHFHSTKLSSRHHRHHENQIIAARNSIFNPEFFTDEFYKQFFKIYMQK
ncbi:unnamed protein product [Thelazia callipaeda]|uniref:Uncharacterized protein n=1 Tax=Thelazia callipaeda TaxID=103827 RepID=A0A0N5D2Y0_THECL|nr:unnamed protein product [Thelazia callipaeda]